MSECSLSYDTAVNTALADPEPPRRQRVAALPPDHRRAAIVEATIPLLREHGLLVTTRQIAEAAGVAEGTIFGVFADKASLIRAAVIKAFDPATAVEIIEDTRGIRDLRTRLVRIVEMLSRGMAMNAPLMAAVRGSAGAAVADDEMMTELARSRDAVTAAVVAAVAPDAARLRRPPTTIAQMIMFMLFASRSGFGQLEALDAAELVSLLLDGALVRDTAATTLPGVA